MTSSSVLVGTDLSDVSFAAIRQGAAWAERHGASLIVAHIHTRLSVAKPDTARWSAAVEKAVRSLTDYPSEIVVGTGSAHAELLEMASARKARLLVVGASGGASLTQALFGSTAASVARYADCPVLVARPSPEAGPVLVGTDFSDAVTPALELARAEAELRGAELVLVHSMFEPSSPLDLLGPIVASAPVPPSDTVAERRDAATTTLNSLLSVQAVRGRAIVVDDDPATALPEEAEKLEASLIVVGTHGRTGLSRMAMGSVAEAIARRAPCSVLVARTPRAQPS
ncbi:MAG TPA: universal stress protein [Polyangiaceae bacterium]